MAQKASIGRGVECRANSSTPEHWKKVLRPSNWTSPVESKMGWKGRSIFFFSVVFFDVLFCNLEAGLELVAILLAQPWVVGLQVCTTTLALLNYSHVAALPSQVQGLSHATKVPPASQSKVKGASQRTVWQRPMLRTAEVAQNERGFFSVTVNS